VDCTLIIGHGVQVIGAAAADPWHNREGRTVLTASHRLYKTIKRAEVASSNPCLDHHHSEDDDCDAVRTA
jgi:hypothetical protein